MAFFEKEWFFLCPYCGSKISMNLDLSVKSQEYIEDCEICCRPILISYQVAEDQLENFSAQQA
jgi:transcription elongation factor Elf1